MTERRKHRDREQGEQQEDPVIEGPAIKEPMRLESSEEHFRGMSDGEILQRVEF